MQIVILLYKNMWILYKSNEGQCFYASCVPPRLSYNPDKAHLFYRTREQLVKISGLISFNYDGSWIMPGVIAAGRYWGGTSRRLKFLLAPPSFLRQSLMKMASLPQLVLHVYLLDYPITRIRQSHFTEWSHRVKYSSWYQAIIMAVEVCRMYYCCNEIVKWCILTTKALINTALSLTSGHIQYGVLTPTRRPCYEVLRHKSSFRYNNYKYFI
jgi:hypothetical protein